MPRSLPSIAIGCVIFAAAAVVHAGPLDPPVGPVVPSFKTLTDTAPRTAVSATNTPGNATALFRITQPGSYYLTGNITGVSGKHGVEITASDVTLDLMGFTLTGVAGSLSGVKATGSLIGLSVSNGSLATWGADGLDLDSAISSQVETVRSRNNTGNGISIGTLSTVSLCVVTGNTGNGVSSISSGGPTIVDRCNITGNQTGIVLSLGTVSTCTLQANRSIGISLQAGSVNDCLLSNHGTAPSTSAIGIQFSSGTISRTTVLSTLGVGISCPGSGVITDCTVDGNTLDGIRVAADSLVRDNHCSLNGNGGDGANIHATGSRNRIEGNHCLRADRGIDVDAADNLIVRNACSNNTTDWDIVANNVFGPIIDRRAPASAAVNGFSAASSLGSTDASANYSY